MTKHQVIITRLCSSHFMTIMLVKSSPMAIAQLKKELSHTHTHIPCLYSAYGSLHVYQDP